MIVSIFLTIFLAIDPIRYENTNDEPSTKEERYLELIYGNNLMILKKLEEISAVCQQYIYNDYFDVKPPSSSSKDKGQH